MTPQPLTAIALPAVTQRCYGTCAKIRYLALVAVGFDSAQPTDDRGLSGVVRIALRQQSPIYAGMLFLRNSLKQRSNYRAEILLGNIPLQLRLIPLRFWHLLWVLRCQSNMP